MFIGLRETASFPRFTPVHWRSAHPHWSRHSCRSPDADPQHRRLARRPRRHHASRTNSLIVKQIARRRWLSRR